MKILKMLTLAAVPALVASLAVANEDQIDMAALTGDYVAANPGFETVVPYWLKFDTNGDSYPDGYKFHFDVYIAGTSTKLFATPVQYFAVCPTGYKPLDADKAIDFKRLGNTIVLAVKQYARCNNGIENKDVDTGYVYAVDLSAAGKQPWAKSFAAKLEGTGILPDMNNNGTGELLVTVTKKNPLNGNNDATVYVYDGKTGTALTTAKTYPIER